MRQTFLIARREFLSYVGTWGFWLSIMSFPLIGVIAGFLISLSQETTPLRHMAIITADASLEAAARSALERDTDIVLVPAPASDPEGMRPYLLGEALVDTPQGVKALDAAVFITRKAGAGVAVDYWSTGVVESGPRQRLATAVARLMRDEALDAAGIDRDQAQRINQLRPEVRQLTPKRAVEDAEVGAQDRAPFIMGAMTGVVLWMVVFSVANMLLTSTIEERSTKVFDALLASTSPMHILAGKLFGVAAVSATLMLVWTVFGLTGAGAMAVLTENSPWEWLSTVANPSLIGSALFFFVAGYLMFGALYLSVGSLCDTMQEAQTLMTPMMLFTLPPIMVVFVMFESPDSLVLRVMSWVPTYTPFIMPVRLATDPPLYEIIGSGLLMVATTVALLWGAAKVFRLGLIGGFGPKALRAAIMRAMFGGKLSASEERLGAQGRPS